MKKRNSFRECFGKLKATVDAYIDYGKRIKKNNGEDPPMDNDYKKEKISDKTPWWIVTLIALAFFAAINFAAKVEYSLKLEIKGSPRWDVQKSLGNKK